MIKKAAAASAVLALLLSGASSTAAPTAAPAKKGVADWTFMVYAVGDTVNVSQLMVENLSQLAVLPDSAKVNVVVLLDLPERSAAGAPTSTLPGADQFTTAKLFQLEGHRFNELRDLGEVAMGRPDTLASFIAEAADRFPAEKYGLALFDHGGGNQGGYVDTGPPGTTALSIPDIRAGMASGMAQAGIKRFDVLFHAACLMSSYETASALAPLAKTMAGSEELMIQYPLSPEGFAPLALNGSGEDVGDAFIEGYGHLLDDIATQGGQTYRDLAAMSVVGGDEIQRLDEAMESFSRVSVAHMDEIATEIGRARADALEFVVGFGEDSSDLIDLGDFLRNLDGLPPEVEVARDAAFAALQNAVQAQVLGRATEQATGLNVYLPTSTRNVGDYLTNGTAPKGWGEFVSAFLEKGVGGVTQQGGGVGFVSPEAKILLADKTGIKIAGQLTSGASANVTSAVAQVFTSMGGRDDVLALEVPAYVNAGGEGQVQGVWGYGVTTLTDGKKVVPVTAGYQDQSGGLVGDFLAQYTAPGGGTSDVGVRLLLSTEGEIEGVSVVDVNNNTAGQVDLQTGGTLQPYLFVRSSGGFQQVLSSQSIAVNPQLTVGFSQLATGTPFTMGVLVSDVQGNFSGASVDSTVK